MFHVLMILREAGWAIVPILAASVVAVALILESIWLLGRSERSLKAWLLDPRTTERSVGKGDDLFTSYLRWQLGNPDAALPARERAAEVVLQDHERRLHWLSTIAAIAPLLGLLGTVGGMIHIFGLVAVTRPDNPLTQLSAGISEALVATLGGIVVAIIAALGHQVQTNRLEGFGAQVERAIGGTALPGVAPKARELAS